MSSAGNMLSEFLEARGNFIEWPSNVLSTDQFEHELEGYREELESNQAALFHPRMRSLYVLDYLKGRKAFQLSSNLGSLQQIKELMNERSEDPSFRYVFIHARNSRAQLSIARDQLLYLLSHQQVMPEFANHIFTFCRRDTPHLQASFKIEDELRVNCQTLRIAELGRSGIRLQHCFNLIGVEHSTEDKNWPYLLRQTAVYNSFDLIGGQAFFLMLKANEVIRERIQKVCCSNKRPNRFDNLDKASVSFSRNLEAHLLIFKWCVEKWCLYLDFLQAKIRQTSAHTRLSPIDEVTKEEVLSRNTVPSPGLNSRKNSGLSFLSRPSRSTSFREFFGLPSNPKDDPTKMQSLDSALNSIAGQGSATSTAEHQDLYKLFSFKELQNLHHTSGKLEEARFVMRQDRTVISDMMARFEKLHKSKAFAAHLSVDDIDFDKFLRGVQSCLRELDDQQDRLKLMDAGLNKTMDLFNGILQYGNMRTGEFFARQANASTVTMEQLTVSMHDLATKTKKDTVSMHVITMITLFFLPGTFVATFFSTDILDFTGDHAMDNLGDWTTRPAALKLFLAICLPLMGIVLLAWGIAYYWARRQSTTFPWTAKNDDVNKSEKETATV